MKCPICDHQRISDIYSKEQVPYSIFWQDNKIIPTIDLVVSMCDTCTFLFQRSAYENNKYDAVMQKIYNAYQIMDSSMRPFPVSENVFSYALNFLSSNIDFLKIKNVLEIGSNRGDFLFHLKSKFGHLNVIGMEPSNLDFVGVPTVKTFFSKDIFSNKFDLIVLRHVLEHIKYPTDFIADIKNLLSPDGVLFIEVPNTKSDIMEKIEVFTPDHVSYFTASAIIRLAEIADMNLKNIVDEVHSFLLVIIDRRSSSNQQTHDRINYNDIKKLIEDYKGSMNNTLLDVRKLIDDGYELVFYGSKNAFLWFYYMFDAKSINGNLKEHTLAVIDDSYERIGKNVLGFPIGSSEGIDRFNGKKILFIICAARGNAKAMINRIKNADLKDYKIILPWVGEVA